MKANKKKINDSRKAENIIQGPCDKLQRQSELNAGCYATEEALTAKLVNIKEIFKHKAAIQHEAWNRERCALQEQIKHLTNQLQIRTMEQPQVPVREEVLCDEIDNIKVASKFLYKKIMDGTSKTENKCQGFSHRMQIQSEMLAQNITLLNNHMQHKQREEQCQASGETENITEALENQEIKHNTLPHGEERLKCQESLGQALLPSIKNKLHLNEKHELQVEKAPISQVIGPMTQDAVSKMNDAIRQENIALTKLIDAMRQKDEVLARLLQVNDTIIQVDPETGQREQNDLMTQTKGALTDDDLIQIDYPQTQDVSDIEMSDEREACPNSILKRQKEIHNKRVTFSEEHKGPLCRKSVSKFFKSIFQTNIEKQSKS